MALGELINYLIVILNLILIYKLPVISSTTPSHKSYSSEIFFV